MRLSFFVYMFACVTEEELISRHRPPQQGVDPTLNELYKECKELKKRVKRVSSMLAETEAQRCEDRKAYEQDLKIYAEKSQSLLLEKNTASLIELAQV